MIIAQKEAAMSRQCILGILLLSGSFLLYLMQLVSRLMARHLKIFTIEELFGLEWIQTIPWAMGKHLMLTLSSLSLSAFLLTGGVLFFVMGGIQRDM